MEAPTNEERRVMAERLRKAARWSYVWIDDKTLRELTGMEPSGLNDDSTINERMDSVREIFRHLADLIDPTCNIDVMDTGERADYDCREHIMHCKNCGAEFGYVLFSEEGDVSMDDKPSYCPNCGDRVAERGES